MKVSLSTSSICRTPVFPTQEQLENVWPRLKAYIQESSPAFYEVIKDYTLQDYPALDVKVRFTIWKYFNRAKFRATPYGNFAAFSIVPLSKTNTGEPIVLAKETITHRFPNWQEKENVNLYYKWLTFHADFFRSNTTTYQCGNDLRFVTIEDSAFELSTVQIETTTAGILSYCKTKRTFTELQEFLKEEYGIVNTLCYYFIEQLLAVQLLITDYHPNIIGTEYFKRIAFPERISHEDYIMAERARKSGSLSAAKLKVLVELTEFLRKHLAPVQVSAMQEFKDQFRKRFEDKAVPLMVAMDPETGIGYRSLAQDKMEDPLVQELKTLRVSANNTTQQLNYAPLQQFILNEMLKGDRVQLENYKGELPAKALPVANTLSILLKVDGELIIVDQMGGCTANSLLGRFSLASEEITALGRQFADKEQEANPDILFFDIAYQIEKNADNINRRKQIYPYELPILSWAESDNIIDPNDIVITLKGDELILHSTTYNRRIVPRLASAYNYSRSDLAVYRFLSDLQQQNLHASLRVNTLETFPGLRHYERVQYKNVVVSTEKWLVPSRFCNLKDIVKGTDEFYLWLESIRLNQPFKAGFSDQHLLFDPYSREEMMYFLLFCRNKTNLYIEESFMYHPSNVLDEENQSYLPEFIVNLEHSEQIYQPSPAPVDHSKGLTQMKCDFLPGEEWLYFEIYCHPSHSNQLLNAIATKYIAPLKSKIKRWFFIRYNDPSYHIRLRLEPANHMDKGMLISALAQLLQPDVNIGVVADLQLKTYRREANRYGWQSIDSAETCFRHSSDMVAQLIFRPKPTHKLYSSSIKLLEIVFEQTDTSLEEQLQFVEHMANLFYLEMKITTEGLKKINQGYKEFSILHEANDRRFKMLPRFDKTVKSILATLSTSPASAQKKLLSDLFHMHVNRLFVTDQRIHEMLIYQYLTRRLKMRIGRLKQEQEDFKMLYE